MLQRFPGGADREVAWRTVVTPMGAIVILHQRATSGRVSTGDNGYAGGANGDAGVPCNGGIVRPMLSVVRVEGPPSRSLSLAPNSLSIDLAVLPDGKAVVAMPGNWGRAGTSGWLEFPTGLIEGDGCVQRTPPSEGMSTLGQVVAAAALPDGGALVQTARPQRWCSQATSRAFPSAGARRPTQGTGCSTPTRRGR